MKTFSKVLIAATVLCISSLVQATTVRLLFEAEITSFTQNPDDPPGNFLGQPITIGDRISGHAQYVTEPSVRRNFPGLSVYSDATPTSGIFIDFKGTSITSNGCASPPCSPTGLFKSYHDGPSYPPRNDQLEIEARPAYTSAGRDLFNSLFVFELDHMYGNGDLPSSLSMANIVSGRLYLDTLTDFGGMGVIATITSLQAVPELDALLQTLACLIAAGGIIRWARSTRQNSLLLRH